MFFFFSSLKYGMEGKWVEMEWFDVPNLFGFFCLFFFYQKRIFFSSVIDRMFLCPRDICRMYNSAVLTFLCYMYIVNTPESLMAGWRGLELCCTLETMTLMLAKVTLNHYLCPQGSFIDHLLIMSFDFSYFSFFFSTIFLKLNFFIWTYCDMQIGWILLFCNYWFLVSPHVFPHAVVEDTFSVFPFFLYIYISESHFYFFPLLYRTLYILWYTVVIPVLCWCIFSVSAVSNL